VANASTAPCLVARYRCATVELPDRAVAV
jgi:hypothetical protein